MSAYTVLNPAPSEPNQPAVVPRVRKEAERSRARVIALALRAPADDVGEGPATLPEESVQEQRHNVALARMFSGDRTPTAQVNERMTRLSAAFAEIVNRAPAPGHRPRRPGHHGLRLFAAFVTRRVRSPSPVSEPGVSAA